MCLKPLKHGCDLPGDMNGVRELLSSFAIAAYTLLRGRWAEKNLTQKTVPETSWRNQKELERQNTPSAAGVASGDKCVTLQQ